MKRKLAAFFLERHRTFQSYRTIDNMCVQEALNETNIFSYDLFSQLKKNIQKSPNKGDFSNQLELILFERINTNLDPLSLAVINFPESVEAFLSLLYESDSLLLLKLLKHHKKNGNFILKYTERQQPELNTYIKALYNKLTLQQEGSNNSAKDVKTYNARFFEHVEININYTESRDSLTPIEQRLTDLNISFDNFVEYCLENVPKDLVESLSCPLTGTLFKEPVISNQNVYERSIVEQQFPDQSFHKCQMVEDMIICLIEEMHENSQGIELSERSFLV